MKRCGRCGLDKPLEQFHRSREGRQAWCKDCRQAYDASYHQRMKHRRLDQKKRLHRDFVAWYVSLKEGRPCTDCRGIFHPRAMQWDHLPGTEKEGDLGYLLRTHNRQRVLAEIAKCELVCANCHAVRTFQRRRGVAQPG